MSHHETYLTVKRTVIETVTYLSLSLLDIVNVYLQNFLIIAKGITPALILNNVVNMESV